MSTAFVFGGGGLFGASEVGMVRALMETDYRPDLVLGTSVGAINGAAVAADPSPDCVEELTDTWETLNGSELFSGPMKRLRATAASRPYLHAIEPLIALLEDRFAGAGIKELDIPFQCCAASIERAAETWFTEGPVATAVAAACAAPGMYPPVEIDGEHYVDGGLVNTLPIGRAIELGADKIFVMHTGSVEQPLAVPTWPWEVATVAYEIARRHRFATEIAALPKGVEVFVMPAGAGAAAASRSRDTQRVRSRIEEAYQASRAYLQSRPASS